MASWSTSPSRLPPSTKARRAAGSTRTPRKRDRSICMPSSQVDLPEGLWPPHFTASSSSRSRAKFTAAWMSATPVGWTTSAGCMSIDSLSTRRAWS